MTHSALLSQFHPNEEWREREKVLQKVTMQHQNVSSGIPFDHPSKTFHHEYSIVFVFLKTNTLIEEEGYYKVENGVILWDFPAEPIEHIINLKRKLPILPGPALDSFSRRGVHWLLFPLHCSLSLSLKSLDSLPVSISFGESILAPVPHLFSRWLFGFCSFSSSVHSLGILPTYFSRFPCLSWCPLVS